MAQNDDRQREMDMETFDNSDDIVNDFDVKEDDILNDSKDVKDIRKIETITGIILLIALVFFAVWLLVRRVNNDVADAPKNEETEVSEEQVVTLEDTQIVSEASDDKEKEEKIVDLSGTPVKTQKVTGELSQFYTRGKMLSWTADDYQLPELYAYWDDYQLDAVYEILNLDRFLEISKALSGSNDFYYYGGKNSKDEPDGKGLAVYANDTYYFGEWKNGMRSGSGMWLRLFREAPGVVNGIEGVTEHSYSGTWLRDLPCGEGQENIVYADGVDLQGELIIQNAIGGFKNGYYDGDMYIMSKFKGGQTDWYGTCDEGCFEFVYDKEGYEGKRPVLQAPDDQETGEEDNCFWMLPKSNSGWGIAGLKG